MTNREWLNTLTDEEFVKENNEGSCAHCSFGELVFGTDYYYCKAEGIKNCCTKGQVKWLKAKNRGNNND